jgi:hypothetical protein
MKYDQPIQPGVLPQGLKKIYFHKNYKHRDSIDTKSLPNTSIFFENQYLF